MATNIHQESDRTAQRAAIERIIAHYPDIGEEELHSVLHYFRRDASAYDRAIIASNAKIYDQYQKLASDHNLDRLGMVEKVVTATFVCVLVLGILFLILGVWEL